MLPADEAFGASDRDNALTIRLSTRDAGVAETSHNAVENPS